MKEREPFGPHPDDVPLDEDDRAEMLEMDAVNQEMKDLLRTDTPAYLYPLRCGCALLKVGIYGQTVNLGHCRPRRNNE